jgi:hypothetical protein
VSSIALAQQSLSPDGAPAAVTYLTALGLEASIEWQMEPGEQMALAALLTGLRPKLAIEIGSRYGGSMQVLSRYAEKVISLDIDPSCRERLGGKFPNAEFITGPSQETFPKLLKQLESEQAELGFVLIDGDHTARGVQGDIRALLDYRPECPLFAFMHDSFNPPVRQGIREAGWQRSNHVHSVELDFVHGILCKGGDAHREMWGGLALAQFSPEPRTGPLTVTARMEHLFQVVRRHSVHWFFDPPTLRRRVVRKSRKLLGLK